MAEVVQDVSRILCLGMAALILAIGILCAVIEDLRFKQIDDFVNLFVAVGSAEIAFVQLGPGKAFLMRVAMAVLIGSLLLLLATKTNAFGGGDVKMIAGISLALNVSSNLAAIWIACVLALLFHIGYRIIKKVKLESVPFAPFITAGYLPFYIALFIPK